MNVCSKQSICTTPNLNTKKNNNNYLVLVNKDFAKLAMQEVHKSYKVSVYVWQIYVMLTFSVAKLSLNTISYAGGLKIATANKHTQTLSCTIYYVLQWKYHIDIASGNKCFNTILKGNLSYLECYEYEQGKLLLPLSTHRYTKWITLFSFMIIIWCKF